MAVDLQVSRKCKKKSWNWGNLIDVYLQLPEQFLPLPPPPANLVRLWRSRKISATTPPPHRIWSASGDHAKSTGWHRPSGPPQTKILATPLCPRWKYCAEIIEIGKGIKWRKITLKAVQRYKHWSTQKHEKELQLVDLLTGCRANETRSKWTRSIFSVPMRRVPIGRVPMRRVPNRRVYYIDRYTRLHSQVRYIHWWLIKHSGKQFWTDPVLILFVYCIAFVTIR